MADFSIKVINNNVYGVNSYIIISGNEAAIIDTPELVKNNSSLNDYKKILGNIEPKLIIYTHGHFDHVSGADTFRNNFPKAKHLIHEDDIVAFDNPNYNASSLFGAGRTYTKADSTFKDGDSFFVGECEFKIIQTPGHTKGSCCFYNKEHKVLITGDTLFAYGIGRTDLYSGDAASIIDSIENKIFILDDDVLIYPGHNEYATKLGCRKKMGVM